MAKNERLEELVRSWLGHQSIYKEQKLNMAEVAEDIQMVMAEDDVDTYMFQLDEDSFVKVTKKTKQKKKLDKAGLANEVNVERSELTTVGMVKLAEDNILKEQHILDHTYTEPKTEVKIKVRKPRKKKED